MNGFTLLSKNQVWGRKKLDILKKRGIKASTTDFSKILGALIFKETTDSSDYNVNAEKRTSTYWTRTRSKENGRFVYTVGKNASKDLVNVSSLEVSIRPAIVIPETAEIPTNGDKPKRAKDGVLEVEYGYYPQNVASNLKQRILTNLYKTGQLIYTGNYYSTLKTGHNTMNGFNYNIVNNSEYEYEGKRYVKIKANSNYYYRTGQARTLSNGESYGENRDEYIWIEVEPVKWLVDEKERIMTTDKLVCSGIPFENYRDRGAVHIEDFEKTFIKKFMDEHLSKEMFQQRSINMQKRKRKNKNPYGLDFGRVNEEDIIREAIKANVSIFLHGKPGCGKSDRVKQLDPDFIELNLSHLDPELLDGLSGEKEGRAVHIKPPWLEELETKCEEEKDKIHILFLEELTNASPVMQAKAYGIALDKKVAGRWNLPENVRVVAAGNELEDSLAANEIAEPLYDRFAHVNIETNVESWLEWAVMPDNSYEKINYEKEDKNRPKIHPSIYTYISYRGEEVLRTPYDREHPRPHADPRRWKMASDMLYASNKPETLRAIVGEEITRDFIEFCKMPTISLEDVINGNYKEEDIQIDMGRKLATVAGLVRVDEANMPKVREFVKKLGPEFLRKFEVQWAGENEERLEQLQEIMLEEKEEHSRSEAKSTAKAGVMAFRKIDQEYQRYLEKEKDENSKEK